MRGKIRSGFMRREGFATDASIIKADAQRQCGVPGDEPADWGGPRGAICPVREYLKALETADVPDNPPKAVSLTDPSSSWTAAHGPGVFAYCTNYLINLDAGMIMDVEASTVNSEEETKATRIMIDRVEEKYDIKPARLVGDTNYGTAPMLIEWSTTKVLHRMYLSGIDLNVAMVPYLAVISFGMKPLMNIVALKGNRSRVTGVHSKILAYTSPKLVRFSTGQARGIVTAAQ